MAAEAMQRRLIFISVEDLCVTESRTARSYWESQWQHNIVFYSSITTLGGGTRSTLHQSRFERPNETTSSRCMVSISSMLWERTHKTSTYSRKTSLMILNNRGTYFMSHALSELRIYWESIMAIPWKRVVIPGGGATRLKAWGKCRSNDVDRKLMVSFRQSAWYCKLTPS